MQEVQLDKHVKLLDSPGIVMATGDSDAATILKNCVKVGVIRRNGTNEGGGTTKVMNVG